jgi:hypothetical protein
VRSSNLTYSIFITRTLALKQNFAMSYILSNITGGFIKNSSSWDFEHKEKGMGLTHV